MKIILVKDAIDFSVVAAFPRCLTGMRVGARYASLVCPAGEPAVEGKILLPRC